MRKTLLLLMYLIFFNSLIYSQVVSTLAGSTAGFYDAMGTSAKFNRPTGICTDGNGNLYVAEPSNNTIRKIEISTGNVTTLAGSTTAGYADGTGNQAQFFYPNDICYDGTGNLFVADYLNNVIRKIEIVSGIVTTFAGNPSYGGSDNGIGITATFNGPAGICSDGLGNLYVADDSNNLIRKINIETAQVTTLAGSTYAFADGIGTAAKFKSPFGICYDGLGNLYVADRVNCKIRKIVIATGEVTTVAGTTQGFSDGSANTAQFYFPTNLSTDGTGNLFVSDVNNNRIRKVVISTGDVTTFSGSTQGYLDGIANTAMFYKPTGIIKDNQGNLFIADSYNHKIRKISEAFSLGVGQVVTHKMSMSPNPADDYIKISLPKNYVLKQIELYNSLGMLVSNKIKHTTDNSLNVSQLSNGMYLLKLTTIEGISKTIKFIKN